MAKLVDALCSGRSARKGVLVRIQFWALSSANAGLFYGGYPAPKTAIIPALYSKKGAEPLLPITGRAWGTRYKC